MLEIFAEKFQCCQKIRQTLVVYGLKHIFFYPYAVVVITIWLVPAIKASDEQQPSMEKQLIWKLQIKTILLEVFCKIVFWKIWQNSYRTPVPGYLFQLGQYTRTTFLWNISRWLLLADLLKSYSENIWKIPKKTPLKKSCLIMLQTLDLKLYDLITRMFFFKI